MSKAISEVKNELKNLCSEYIDILDKLKKENIITQEVFDDCSCNKIKFLEE